MKVRALFVLAGAAMLLAGCTTDEGTDLSAESESRLMAELEGYVADGPAVSCVSSRDLQGNRTVGRDVIVFSGSAGRKWVNHSRGSCPSLEFGRALRFTTVSSQLCSGEIAAVFDPVNGIEYGACALGNFTPYRRAR